jgi:dTDP-4-dehydrorhamnose reductase
VSGTWHLTAAGQTSWHGFAQAIFERAVAAGLLARAPEVLAIPTSEYPTPARRPAYSCLDITRLHSDFDLTLPSWETGLDRVITELA